MQTQSSVNKIASGLRAAGSWHDDDNAENGDQRDHDHDQSLDDQDDNDDLDLDSNTDHQIDVDTAG